MCTVQGTTVQPLATESLPSAIRTISGHLHLHHHTVAAAEHVGNAIHPSHTGTELAARTCNTKMPETGCC